MRLLMTLALLPGAVAAQCGPDAAVMASLAGKYGEAVQMAGMTSKGTLLRVVGNPDTGTWTVIETSAAMVTCIRAVGENMEVEAAPAAAMGEDG